MACWFLLAMGGIVAAPEWAGRQALPLPARCPVLDASPHALVPGSGRDAGCNTFPAGAENTDAVSPGVRVTGCSHEVSLCSSPRTSVVAGVCHDRSAAHSATSSIGPGPCLRVLLCAAVLMATGARACATGGACGGAAVGIVPGTALFGACRRRMLASTRALFSASTACNASANSTQGSVIVRVVWSAAGEGFNTCVGWGAGGVCSGTAAGFGLYNCPACPWW